MRTQKQWYRLVFLKMVTIEEKRALLYYTVGSREDFNTGKN